MSFAFNPFDEATRRDPYPLYAQARREHPVHPHPGLPVVSLFRFEDIQAVLEDPAGWSSDFPLPEGMERRQDLPPSIVFRGVARLPLVLERARGAA